MEKIGNVLIPFFAFFLAPLVWAQQGTVVTSSVDQDKVEVDQPFTLTISVQTSENVDVEEPQLPPLSGLEILQKWDNTAVQQSLVQTPTGMDFKTIRKREFHYTLQARKAGAVNLEAFEVVVNGKLFKTEPLIVEIFPSGQAPQSSRGRQRGSGGSRFGQPAPGGDDNLDPEEEFLQQQEEIFNQLLQRQFGGGGLPGRAWPGQPSGSSGSRNRPGGPATNPDFRTEPTNPNEAFFIQVEVDKLKVFEGEQVTVSWYLLTRGQMETLDRVKFPSLKGFWKEIIEENPQITFSEEIINGVPYRKALLASHALFPIKAGKALIDEFTVKSRVRSPSRTFGFGFGRAYEYTKSSKRVEITVKPVPLGPDRPKSFTGAVGQYEVSTQISGNQIPVNQPFSYKIRFEGQGNAKAIELPGIEWPAGLEVYDTKTESRFFKDGTSFKEFEVLLIPRKEGPLEIPGVQFAFFNSKTGQFEQRSTQPIKMNFTPSNSKVAPESNAFLGGSAEEKSPSSNLTLPDLVTTAAMGPFGSPWSAAFSSGAASARVPAVWSLFLWGLLISFVSLVSVGYRELRPQSKSVSLRKKLDRYWKKVETSFSQTQSRQVGIEIVNCFNLVLAEVTSHKGETQEIQKMLEKLDPEKRNLLGASILKYYEEAQLLGFAPDGVLKDLGAPDRMKELMSQSKKVLYKVCE